MRPSWIGKASRLLREMEANQRIRRSVGAAVSVCTIAFLVFVLVRNIDEVREFDDWSTYLGVCAKGFFLHPVSLITQALTWRLIIVRLGRMIGSWGDIEIYSYSYLMRHLPGMIWYLAGRAAMYRRRGIRASVALVASGLEWFLLLVAAFLVYGTFTVMGSDVSLASIILLAALTVAAAFGLRQALLAGSKLPAPGSVRLRLTALATESIPGATDLILWLSLYVLAYFIGGWMLLILVNGVAPEVTLGLGTATRIWALTGGIGSLLSAIVPAGLGIRELTLAVLLSPAMSRTGAVLVAILLRMAIIAGDLVWANALYAVARLMRQHRQGADLSSPNGS